MSELENYEFEYANKARWQIYSDGDLAWARYTYEKDIETSRKKARFLFNCLFDYGLKQLEEKGNAIVVKQ